MSGMPDPMRRNSSHESFDVDSKHEEVRGDNRRNSLVESRSNSGIRRGLLEKSKSLSDPGVSSIDLRRRGKSARNNSKRWSGRIGGGLERLVSSMMRRKSGSSGNSATSQPGHGSTDPPRVAEAVVRQQPPSIRRRSSLKETEPDGKPSAKRKSLVRFQEETKSPGGVNNSGKILVERNMSRRTRRNSMIQGRFQFPGAITINLKNGREADSNSMGYIHQMGVMNSMKNCLKKRNNSLQVVEETLQATILKTLSNDALCDVELVGRDGVPVSVPGFLLAAHSEVFLSMFYQNGKANKGTNASHIDKEVSDRSTHSIRRDDDNSPIKHTVELPFARWDALDATVHFLACRSLPDGLEENAGAVRNENNIRSLCQIYLFGRLFRIPALMNQAYRTARRSMNKTPKLVCAAFDECKIMSEGALLPQLGDGSRASSSSMWGHDELVEYALEYLRDSPVTTLLAGGTRFLSADSIEAVISDEDMDVDEYTMFHILNTWVMQDKENNAEKGRALVSLINLSYIKTDSLKGVVRNCGFVKPSAVEAALRQIEETLANQSPDEKEHVLVEGAGHDEIDGIYVRVEEDIGLGGEEVMFVKEAPEEDEGYGPDYGLYLLRSTWAITSCVDYSNILYSYEPRADQPISAPYRPPSTGWETVGGAAPPPRCTWKPSKNEHNFKSSSSSSTDGYVAPDLSCALSGRSNGQVWDVANGDHDEGNRRMTLRTMLNLPTDEGHEDEDYHDDIDDDSKK